MPNELDDQYELKLQDLNMADKIIIVKEKKRGIGCGCLFVLILVSFCLWKIYNFINDRPRLSDDQRKNQHEVQRRMSVDLRLKDLEETNGGGRERLNKNVENAARILYNIRHPNDQLPLVEVPKEQQTK